MMCAASVHCLEGVQLLQNSSLHYQLCVCVCMLGDLQQRQAKSLSSQINSSFSLKHSCKGANSKTTSSQDEKYLCLFFKPL